MNYKSFTAQVKAVSDGPEGRAEILFSTYTRDPDCYGDVIQPGAFAKVIAEGEATGNWPALVWSHDWVNGVLGSTLSIRDTPNGPLALVEFDMEDPYCVNKWRKLARGDVKQASFAFEIESERYDRATNTNYLEIIYPVYEIGPCLVGANQTTEVVSVRSHGKNTASYVFEDLPESLKIEAAQDHALARSLGIKTEWLTAFVNDLPDDAFAVIEPAYAAGETREKSARHLPFVKGREAAVLGAAAEIVPVTDSITAAELRARAVARLTPQGDEPKASPDPITEVKTPATQQQVIQTIHDHAMSLGAVCQPGDSDQSKGAPEPIPHVPAPLSRSALARTVNEVFFERLGIQPFEEAH